MLWKVWNIWTESTFWTVCMSNNNLSWHANWDCFSRGMQKHLESNKHENFKQLWNTIEIADDLMFLALFGVTLLVLISVSMLLFSPFTFTGHKPVSQRQMMKALRNTSLKVNSLKNYYGKSEHWSIGMFLNCSLKLSAFKCKFCYQK